MPQEALLLPLNVGVCVARLSTPKLKYGGGAAVFFGDILTGVHRGSRGYTGVHGGTQGYTEVHRGTRGYTFTG